MSNTKLFLLFLLFTASFTARSQYLLVDEANILKPDEKDLVAKRLKDIRTQRGVDVRCYIPVSLNGKSPDQVTAEQGERMKIGSIGVNNGILILILPKEEQVFITNAYGVQWIITDEETNKIIDALLGTFKAKEYKQGILDALNMIDKKLTGYSFKVNEAYLGKTDFSKLKGMVVALDYTYIYTNGNFRVPVEADQQFDRAFKIELKNGSLKAADLLYNKYMEGLVKEILSTKKRLIFARVKSAVPLELELMGFMKY
ncbi:MAG: TPM domain-containing protein [Bacteroidota bacterium]